MQIELLDLDNVANMIKPKGYVKVELFDNNGNKKYEQKSRNFISQGVLKHYFKRSLLNTWLGIFNESKKATSFFGDNMFYQIVLTTASHPEDAMNEWIMKGKKIGYALTYSDSTSSDPLMGTLNRSESYVNLKQVHAVFDFATDKANGTFQSIYFMPNESYCYNSYVYEQKIYESGSLLKVEKVGSIFYMLSGKLLITMDENFNIVTSTTLSFNGTIMGFTIKGSEIFYCMNDYTIKKAPLSNPSNVTKVKDADKRYDGILWVPEENRFYCSYGDNNYHTILHYYDSSFNILGSMTYTTLSRYGSGEGLLKEGNGFIKGREYLDNDSLNAIQIANGSTRVIGSIGDKLILNNYDVSYIAQKINIGSRCLLKEPVTKTEVNTMKITYDFYFQ